MIRSEKEPPMSTTPLEPAYPGLAAARTKD